MEVLFEKIELPEDQYAEVISQLKEAEGPATFIVGRGEYADLEGLRTALILANVGDVFRKKDPDNEGLHRVTVRIGESKPKTTRTRTPKPGDGVIVKEGPALSLAKDDETAGDPF